MKGADVVVHLAFAILEASDATRELNIEGSRRVFEEAAKAGAKRICYASSVAAYGFHDDNPDWLTEDIPPRGSPEHPYSDQKAEVERVLGEVLLRHPSTVAYAFRPCIVAGPEARTMLEEIPYYRLEEAMPDSVRAAARLAAGAEAGHPGPGHPLPARARGRRGQRLRGRRARRRRARALQPRGQRHADDADVADALGWYSIPVPKPLVDASAEIATRLPLMPEQVAWIHSVRKPVLMRTTRAKQQLRWRPKHTARATLKEMADAQRAARYSSA